MENVEENKGREKGLKTTTIWLMISTAVFFDALQILLDFIVMGWIVSPFAAMTFWLWFKMHGISFAKPGRIAGSAVTFFIDMVPIAGWFAWTTSISIFVWGKKITSAVGK